MTGKKRGRNYKLTRDLIEKVAELYPELKIEKYIYSHPKVKVSHTQWHKWINKGEALISELEKNPDKELLEIEELFVEFVLTLEEARVKIVQTEMEQLDEHKKNPKNASVSQWILKMVDPETFSDRQKIDAKIEDKTTLTTSLLDTIKRVQEAMQSKTTVDSEETTNKEE